MKFTDCIEIVGNRTASFDGEKRYISTGAVDVNHINEDSVEIITYEDRPSRADLSVSAGDVIFAKMAGTQKNMVIDEENEDNIYSTGFFAVRGKAKIISTKCLYYLVNSDFFLKQKDKHSSGATQMAITNKGLDNIIVSVPCYSEQEKIVRQLDSVSLIIEERKKELGLLDNLIKARFLELFGDVIRNDNDWDVKQFSEMTTSRLGKMLDAKQQTGTCTYPYLANFNVQWFGFKLDNLNTMDFDDKDRKEFCLEEGDLLVCEGGEIGRCAVWHKQVENCYFQKALHRVRCNQDVILPDYLAWWFKYNCEHNGFAAIEGTKATISHLTGANLKTLKVVVPDIENQYKFVEFLKQVDKSKVVVQRSLDETQLLFDSLMQKYFG